MLKKPKKSIKPFGGMKSAAKYYTKPRQTSQTAPGKTVKSKYQGKPKNPTLRDKKYELNLPRPPWDKRKLPVKSKPQPQVVEPQVTLPDRSDYTGLDNPSNPLYSALDNHIYGSSIPNAAKEATGYIRDGKQLNNAEAASWNAELAAAAGLPYTGVDKYGTPSNNIPTAFAPKTGHPSSMTYSTLVNEVPSSTVDTNFFPQLTQEEEPSTSPMYQGRQPESQSNYPEELLTLLRLLFGNR